MIKSPKQILNDLIEAIDPASFFYEEERIVARTKALKQLEEWYGAMYADKKESGTLFDKSGFETMDSYGRSGETQ